MLDREFERFHGGANEARSKRLHVTITPQRLIRLNRNVYKLIGEPSAVYLNYSRKRDMIAIEPASIRVAESFPVISLGEGRGWRINAAPFCRHFKIDADQTLKFISPEFEGRTLYLKLGETISVAARKRKKR